MRKLPKSPAEEEAGGEGGYIGWEGPGNNAEMAFWSSQTNSKILTLSFFYPISSSRTPTYQLSTKRTSGALKHTQGHSGPFPLQYFIFYILNILSLS